jgi:hypothetical protein
MASINALPSLSYTDLYSSFTELPSGLYLGSLQFGENGKAFRLVKAGGSALVVGNTLQSSANATITDFDGLAVATAAAAGATQVTLTNGSTAVTANLLDGGTFVVSTSSTASANIGEEYTIVGHGTATGGASLLVFLDRPLRTALTTATTTVALRRSPWSGVVQSTGGAATGTPVGVAIYPIPASSFGWVQTKGVAGVLSDNSTFAVGSAVGPSVAVAGACGVIVAATARTFIGDSMSAANSTHAIQVNLRLD